VTSRKVGLHWQLLVMGYAYCVTFTADVGIKKLKSDLFLQILLAVIGGGVRL